MNNSLADNGDKNFVVNLPAKKKQKTDEEEQTITTTTATGAAGFSSLPKEVVGTLSTFLELDDVSNLVRSIPREQSVTVKQPSYMKRNFRGMKYRSAAYMKTWIEVNNDWKEMYDNPEQHGLLTEKDKKQFEIVFNNVVVATFLDLLVVVKHLVNNRDADINAYEEDGIPLSNGRTYSGTALLAALICPSVELPLLEFLLSSPKIDVNKMFSHMGIMDGYTALHHAITLPSLTPEKLRLLLKHPKIEVHLRTRSGYASLHLVCYNLDSSSEWKARILIEAGADVNIRDNYHQQTALEFLNDQLPLEGSDKAKHIM